MNNLCPQPVHPCQPWTRRDFLFGVSSLGLMTTMTLEAGLWSRSKERRIAMSGPGAQYIPKIHAAFVRRQEPYGMLWPGAIYDGEKARAEYRREMLAAEKDLSLKLTLRPDPIYSLAEADAWIADARADHADGLLLIVLDRQRHAWPTAGKAIASGIPTVVFSPVGTSFTTNTAPLAGKNGGWICSTSDFRQARWGLKMFKTGAKIREMRYVVIKGNQRRDAELGHFGTKLRYLPARSFLEEYQNTPLTEEIKEIAAAYWRGARRINGPSKNDLYNGIKSYIVARNILEREQGDGITMDCLGALGQTEVSLPCIAWSKMLDAGIPAACEADLGACLTHALVQYLFERPGFQQDPVAETACDCLIGAHCTCPTRLYGFARKSEPYDLMHHHGNRDAVPRPYWRKGQSITIADIILPAQHEYTRDMIVEAPKMVISTGQVVDNVAVPPAGGCVVSVQVKLDTEPDLLQYPGFHQLFFYGNFKKELLGYCQLYGITPVTA